MAHPQHTWGKGQAAYVRYELGRLVEEDESIESDVPHVFGDKDDIRSTPRTTTTKKKKNRLPRPSKNEPIIPRDEADGLMYGDYERGDLNAYAQFYSDKKQKQRACFARGHHDWRRYESEWSGKRSFGYVCADCGSYG